MTREDGKSLLTQKCEPCEGGVCPIEIKDARNYMSQLSPEWKLVENEPTMNHKTPSVYLARGYRHKDYADANDHANRIGILAESEGHHPELNIGWGHLNVEIWTHAIQGLSANDFILAAKIENEYRQNDKNSSPRHHNL